MRLIQILNTTNNEWWRYLKIPVVNCGHTVYGICQIVKKYEIHAAYFRNIVVVKIPPFMNVTLQISLIYTLGILFHIYMHICRLEGWTKGTRSLQENVVGRPLEKNHYKYTNTRVIKSINVRLKWFFIIGKSMAAFIIIFKYGAGDDISHMQYLNTCIFKRCFQQL